MKKTTLFNLTNEYLVLRDLASEIDFNEDTGEVIDNTDTIQELYNGLKDDLDVKLNNTMYVIKELQGDSNTLDAEIKRLQNKKKVIDNKAELIKSLIFKSVSFIEGKTLVTDKFKFVVSKNQESTVVPDVEDLPRAYRKATWAADKKAIKEALQSGIKIEGCSLVRTESLKVK